MTLTEFLLARIAEDEETAGEELRVGAVSRDTFLAQQWLDVMRRVLAECEAKRQIVAEHEMTTIRRAPGLVRDPDGDYWWNAYCRRCTMDGEYADITKEPSEQPCPTLRAIAAVYADHPDYREEWKP